MGPVAPSTAPSTALGGDRPQARGRPQARLGWYLKRLEKMSTSEVAWRTADQVRKWAWARDQVSPSAAGRWRAGAAPLPSRRAKPNVLERPRFSAVLPPGALEAVPPGARKAVISAAEDVLAGRWEVLGLRRTDLADPDWFWDPLTGRRAPQEAYCFKVNHRQEDLTGNVKQIWELSRMHHVTVLAAAYALSGDDRFAERAAAHLGSWWEQNPFLSGVHWTSGIEAGVRLISWVWARRLLDGWAGATALFEHNDCALAQIWWHQRYLAGFRSHGSSANNHVIAEAAGQLVAALAFNWFDQSPAWAAAAAKLLQRELARNTFASGVNREMAFEYHGFVAELALVAALEADNAGRPLPEQSWRVLSQMVDVVAACVDVRLRPPRSGDGDDGRALVLDPAANRWESLLATGRALFGSPAWWPVPAPSTTAPSTTSPISTAPDVTSTLLAAMSARRRSYGHPAQRPCHFDDAGLTVMRSAPAHGPEIWCRCDAGPHGFLSIAAHAHADALAIEVRHNGVDVLADPGTYCYHGEPAARSYFRSTIGHNTLELGGQDQSTSGGPFLWARHARARLLELRLDEQGEAVRWSAEHDGYQVLGPPATHRRTVCLLGRERRLEVTDEVDSAGEHPFRLAFHLGPALNATIDGTVESTSVTLAWAGPQGQECSATMELPAAGTWRLARGETDPWLGWYSPRFGERQPSTTILGEGTCRGRAQLRTVVQFHC